MGEIIQQHDEHESVSVTQVDLSSVTKARQQIPALSNKRHDLYDTVLKQ